MKIQTVSRFPCEGDDGADSLFIAFTSFERRCIGFAEFLRQSEPKYKAGSVLAVTYGDREDHAVRSRVSRFTPQLMSLLRHIARDRRVEYQHLDPYRVIEASTYFERLFHAIPNQASVVVDISTITRLHLPYLLQAARKSARIRTLRVAYTRATYGRYDTLSWGAEEPLLLPGFGHPRARRHTQARLILFCGLEPDRCYSIWRRFGQTECVKVFIDSGDEDLDRCADRAVRLNSFDPTARSVVLPAFQPNTVKAFLEEEYRECLRLDKYLCLAPLTTKWEMISVWNFFEDVGLDAQAGIVYAVPGRLNATNHTRDELGDCLAATLW